MLYVYNRENPLNTDKTGEPYRRYVNEAQARTVSILRRRKGKPVQVDRKFFRSHRGYFLKSALLNLRLLKKYFKSHWDTSRLRQWRKRRRQGVGWTSRLS